MGVGEKLIFCVLFFLYFSACVADVQACRDLDAISPATTFNTPSISDPEPVLEHLEDTI